MRLPYTPSNPSLEDPSDAAIVSRILARRGSRGLIALDRALLHSPPVADGWNTFLGAIRTGTTLPADIREIAICRVAVLNSAAYEWEAHAPIAAAVGVSKEALESLKRKTAMEADRMDGLSDRQKAVVDYTDAMTREVKVSDSIFEKLRARFGDREIVEITATVAAYNCVSRFLVALDVGDMNGKDI